MNTMACRLAERVLASFFFKYRHQIVPLGTFINDAGTPRAFSRTKGKCTQGKIKEDVKAAACQQNLAVRSIRDWEQK